MARMITKDFTFDDMQNEVRYTRASLKADPVAEVLLPRTDSLLGLIARAREQDELARTAQQEASASRYVANTRLDVVCRSFGRDLAHALSNDRSGARWHRFFKGTVDDFISQPLGDQADACLAWLAIDEPLLAPHRETIERWARAAKAALSQTDASAQVRGTAMVAKEQLAEDLTRARDGVAVALATLADEHGLGRNYADGFFIREKKRAKAAKEE